MTKAGERLLSSVKDARSTYKFCEKCNNYAFFSDSHSCIEYEWHVDDYHGEDEWDSIYEYSDMYDFSLAAEKAAEIFDRDDYPLLRGKTAIIDVRRKDKPDDVRKYSVYGEAVPKYYATEIEY